MIPQQTVDVLRRQANISIDTFGIDCDLYVPNNIDIVQYKDVYSKPSDYTFDHYSTIVWVEWSPNNRRLREFGLFAENELPILARFQTEAYADNGTIKIADIIIKSYFKVAIQFVPTKYSKTDEFEIVDTLTSNKHDAVISQIFKCAPRRTK